MSQPYNPLEKSHLAESVVKQLLEQPLALLENIDRFSGAGVYAIYYRGDFSAYKSIVVDPDSDPETQVPIYVGKAIPPGGRKGGLGFDSAVGTALYDRLRQHRSSVRAASNLDEKDFYFRALVVDDIWIPLAETLLITKFRPIWNVLLDGFGIHDPGGGRTTQKRSSWDTLHPGRPWANSRPQGLHTADEILKNLEQGQSVAPEIES
jgi:hypothetical protein